MGNIEKAVTDQLKAIPVSEFQRSYEEWEQTSPEMCSVPRELIEGEKLDL